MSPPVRTKISSVASARSDTLLSEGRRSVALKPAREDPLTEQAFSTSPRRFSNGVDIHSHPLPGIDDGAKTMFDSLAMARIAVRMGTNMMVATPHRFFGGKENHPDALREKTIAVNAALADTVLGDRFRLLPGQEIPLTLQTAKELQSGKVMTIGDTGVYALVEPPFNHLPEWTAEAIAAIVSAGFHPVLAHPERNAQVKARPALALDFVEAGALLQLTAMSVSGANGPEVLEAARWILDQGLATVVASDAHSPTWRPPTLRAAYHAVRERNGVEAARRLCCDNPRSIALGEQIHA